MHTEITNKTLPVLTTTPARWAEHVLTDPLALLNDHAYLEKKAATNALDLLGHWPQKKYHAKWAEALTSIARDETTHLNMVTRLIRQRGGTLALGHHSQYASDLRKLVRRGQGNDELVDRLLVSAMIEARSCERFGVLAQHAQDGQLKSFYDGLWSSEFGHYQVFLELALEIIPPPDVQIRWQQILQNEAEIIQNQPVAFGIHSGIPAQS